jgi:hypothetical protein
MNERHNQNNPDRPKVYQIRLKGHLGEQWANWFDGLTISMAENGDTLLTGPVADQAALFGLLRKVRDVGIPLVAITCLDQADVPNVNH